MDVSGRGASNRPGSQSEQGPDEYSTGNLCKQCQEVGLSVPADGYCSDCEHYLCRRCIKLHSLLRLLKDHTVLTGVEMPHKKPQASGVKQCSNHPGRPVELYCQFHDTLGCMLCFTIGHDSCQDFRPISDLSKDIESSKEFRDIQTAIQQNRTTVELYRKLIAECHEINDSCYDESLDDFQSFRGEVESVLDCLGERVTTKAMELKEKNKRILDSVSERVTSLDKEMTSLMEDIELKQKLKQIDQLFIVIKANMKSVEDNVQELQELKNDIQVQRYMFHNYSQIKECLDVLIMGGIEWMSENIWCAGKISIKSPDDKNDCNINGIIGISSTRMIITDHDNQSLKLIDADQRTIITKRSLTSGPWDVTVIPGSRVVVTVPDLEQLQFFTTDTGLEPCGYVAVDGQCISVESTGDRLVVGYRHPPKVQLMDLNGQVLKSFTTDSSGNPLFRVPRYLSVSPDQTSIFISDWENNTVTRMSTEGTIEWVYSNPSLEYPLGVTTGPDGCLCICSRDADCLHRVSALGLQQHIISEEDKLVHPGAICYSKDKNGMYMYVSSASTDPEHCNFIQRYIVQPVERSEGCIIL